MIHETAKRSLVKTVLYRLVITALTAVAFFLLGRDVSQAIGESVGINFFYAICYYINERIWARINWGFE